MRWHTHDAWELVYCTSGQGAFRFENGTVLPYRVGEMVAIPPLEVHANSSREGFTNIHLTIADPSFPYKTPFRVADDDTGSLHSAFTQAKTYYMTDIRGRELVLEALGALITSYIVVFRSSAAFSEPVEKIREGILKNYSRVDFSLDEVIRQQPFHYDYLRKRFKKEVGVSPPGIHDESADEKRGNAADRHVGKRVHRVGDRPDVRLRRRAVFFPGVQKALRLLPQHLCQKRKNASKRIIPQIHRRKLT